MQPYHIFTVNLIEDESMGADVTSSSYNVNEVGAFSVQVIWSGGGTPVGNFILQGSNDDSTFTDIVAASISGNSGSILINVERHAYAYIRLFYDRTSGTATLNAIVNGKQG